MAWSELQGFGGSESLELDHLRATQRGVLVGAIGVPVIAHKAQMNEGVVFESGAELAGFVIGAAFLGAWFGLGFLSPALWLLEKGAMKLACKGDNLPSPRCCGCGRSSRCQLER